MDPSWDFPTISVTLVDGKVCHVKRDVHLKCWQQEKLFPTETSLVGSSCPTSTLSLTSIQEHIRFLLLGFPIGVICKVVRVKKNVFSLDISLFLVFTVYLLPANFFSIFQHLFLSNAGFFLCDLSKPPLGICWWLAGVCLPSWHLGVPVAQLAPWSLSSWLHLLSGCCPTYHSDLYPAVPICYLLSVENPALVSSQSPLAFWFHPLLMLEQVQWPVVFLLAQFLCLASNKFTDSPQPLITT